jgi:hypothetical protein
MLLFRSEEAVQAWCAERGQTPGAIVALAQLGRLARAWYGDRLQADWRPRTVQQSRVLLNQVGLRGEFWRLA